MLKKEIGTIISSLLLICLTFLFILISSVDSAAIMPSPEVFAESQDTSAILPVPPKQKSTGIIKPTEERNDITEIITTTSKTCTYPELKDLTSEKIMIRNSHADVEVCNVVEENSEQSIEIVSTTQIAYDKTSHEYYKQRADNWIIKDVANMSPITNLTSEEIDLFERLVECELRGNDQDRYYGKLAIANVILNRYRTDYWEFPDTIKEVICQKNQFEPVSNGFIYEVEVTELSKTVVKDALNGVMIIEPDVYYFCTLDTDGKEWFEDNLEFYGHFSGHDFYSLK